MSVKKENREVVAAPQYYINNPMECDDDTALLIYNSITEYTEKLISDDTVEEFYRQLGTPGDWSADSIYDVMNNHIEAVVVHVLEQIENSGYSEDVVVAQSRWILGDNGPYHYWIKYRTPDGDVYHFDPICPWGVSDYKYLPRIRENISFVDEKTEEKVLDPRAHPNIFIGGYYQMQK